MTADITVYDVPDGVWDRLAENAAERSQSLEEYLRQELELIAATPSAASLTEKMRRRTDASETSMLTSETPGARDECRN